jgi:hypothetical protein
LAMTFMSKSKMAVWTINVPYFSFPWDVIEHNADAPSLACGWPSQRCYTPGAAS